MVSAACTAKSPARTTVPKMAASAYNQKLMIGNKNLQVEIVNTPEKMAQGLSGREKLRDGEGMLFVFNQKQTPAFWMKKMKFDLDLIWAADDKIIGMTPNVPAPSSIEKEINLPRYYPPAVVDEVLEVNAGWTEKNRIAIGDAVSLK